MSHSSQEELSRHLAVATEQVQVGSRYTHYKQPDKTYLVTGLAILEATEEVAVIYQAAYGDSITFIRPLSSWIEIVAHEGVSVPRFSPSL